MSNEGTIDVAAKYVTTTIAIAKNVTTQNSTVLLGERLIESVDIYFAPGHAGLTGVRISYGGVVMLPWNQGTAFLIGANERRVFEVGLHVSGPVTVTTQNLDKGFAHSFALTWKLREITLIGQSELPDVPPLASVG